jgi:hypothetical protein
MQELTGLFGYKLFDTPRIRVTAFNEKGVSSAPSEVSSDSATVKTVPSFVPKENIARGNQTSENLLHIVW